MTTPNPGSTEALDLGCTCPVIDNHYGRGYHGIAGEFVYTFGCPIHFCNTEVEFVTKPSESITIRNPFSSIKLIPLSTQVRDRQELEVWML